MKMEYTSATTFALGIVAAVSYFAWGEVREKADSASQSVSRFDPERSRSIGTERPLPTPQGSISEARKKIDPRIFQQLGPNTYQIVRLEDARPLGDALEYIQGLIPRSASGDPLATFSIYLAVSDCRNYLSGTTDPHPADGPTGPGDLTTLEKTERKISECAALTTAQTITQENWLEIAAQQESMEAKLYYSIDSNSVIGDSAARIRNPEKVIEWKKQSISYLQEAAETGSIDAISRLSSAYENGIIVGENIELAYAYALVANMVKPDSSGPTLINNLERNLSTRQRESGAVLSRTIYKSCCTILSGNPG